ncbi:hypothetical protein DF052_26630 [Burkholderia glumae]|nr:hypothetical protein DF052_26630 [Burkholderia glumae]
MLVEHRHDHKLVVVGPACVLCNLLQSDQVAFVRIQGRMFDEFTNLIDQQHKSSKSLRLDRHSKIVEQFPDTRVQRHPLIRVPLHVEMSPDAGRGLTLAPPFQSLPDGHRQGLPDRHASADESDWIPSTIVIMTRNPGGGFVECLPSLRVSSLARHDLREQNSQSRLATAIWANQFPSPLGIAMRERLANLL